MRMRNRARLGLLPDGRHPPPPISAGNALSEGHKHHVQRKREESAASHKHSDRSIRTGSGTCRGTTPRHRHLGTCPPWRRQRACNSRRRNCRQVPTAEVGIGKNGTAERHPAGEPSCMQEASRRKLKAASVLVIYSVPESLLVACCIQARSMSEPSSW